MISEFVLNIVFSILTVFLELLPDIPINIDSSMISTFMGYVSMVFYLLPMGTVSAIFKIIILLSVFRIIVALVKTIWDMLPLV